MPVAVSFAPDRTWKCERIDAHRRGRHRASQVIAIARCSAKTRGRKTEADLNDLVRQVLTMAHGELESHLVSLQVDLRENLPHVLGDRVPLQQVFINLIMNAIEAMATVANRPRVLSASSEIDGAHHVLIKLKDSGAGIDSDDMGRIFETFFTPKDARSGLPRSIGQWPVPSPSRWTWS
jgi:C4-dicarboxylate-specific signal transduction histidine kinase